MQKSALNEHSGSTDHTTACSLNKQQLAIKGHTEKAKEISSNKLESQLVVVFDMAKRMIPCHQFVGQTELLRALKAPDFISTDGIYRHSDSVDDMERSVESVLLSQLDAKIQESEFIGVIIDETVNITVDKKLIVYLKLENRGKTETCFLGNFDVDDGTAKCIFAKMSEQLQKRGVALSRVLGLGSDGASVMTGNRGGVGTLLKTHSPFSTQVHCGAHRVALVALDASKAVEAVAAFKRTTTSIYSYYKHSATKTKRLRNVALDLNDDDMISLKQPCAVRWLSLQRAVDSIQLNWPALVTQLGKEAEGNAQALGLHREILTYQYIAWIHTLADVLPVMTKLNLVFQKDDVNLSMIKPMVRASDAALIQLRDAPGPAEEKFLTECQDGIHQNVKLTRADARSVQAFKNARERYIQHLIDALHERFPDDTLNLLSSLDTLLNPDQYPQEKESLREYARQAIDQVAGHFGEEKVDEDGVVTAPLINGSNFRRDAPAVMTALLCYGGLRFTGACGVLIRDMAEMYPEWATLAKIAVVIPVSSVPAERGFSLQTRIKTADRSRLGDVKVTRLMRIASCRETMDTMDFKSAATYFNDAKKRKK
ncbi:uncharacterized protein C17orf113-like [Diretmus argenteus]